MEAKHIQDQNPPEVNTELSVQKDVIYLANVSWLYSDSGPAAMD